MSEKTTFKVSQDVWVASVQLFQLAMLLQRDVTDAYDLVEVEVVDGSVRLTGESRAALDAKFNELANQVQLPSDSEDDQLADEQVFVLGQD